MIVTLQTLIFFRESLLNALDRLLRPYYNKLSLAFGRKGEASDDEESDEQVFAEYDEERGVVFYPPMYLQRYAAVSDSLMDEQWCGKLEKVVDLGYHDMSFINYLKEVQGVKCILGVDLESIPLRCSIDVVGCEDYVPKRENPLEVTLFKGNAADPDYRLIGCDAVIAIEMIEHMLPHDLDRLIHTVFGFIKPWIAIFTTPNGDFNVLFKALEKNGLRRLDHFFEWSQEQFHDWCSNIVVRYPQYSVSCKGIGPGPNGTKHLGCCSQMALFVAKDYNKQQDLNLNSLALVSDTPSPHSISNLISSWETLDIPYETNTIEPPKNTESYSELQSGMQSSITLVLSTPTSSQDTIIYQDKTSQCNLDNEIEKSYLMFDYEQMCFDVLKPRRNVNNHRVYDIEDVFNRLNCTTLEVKKFSKTTLNLMAKNKLDTLVHTREVVDEIRHLTKLLNFNKEMNNQLENGTHTWCNINWGENAPYWNQYYKIVKAYHYPFEVKSDECRILDLISDEINRLIDTQYDEEFSFEVNKLEIPIEILMRVVDHITDDVEKVKDLLEWNGYEVVGNFVVHSRIIVDDSSAGTQEDDSPDTTDVYSDWDSTSVSDGSTNVPDYHEEKSQEMIALKKIKEDNTALRIVDKYKHLVNQTDDMDAQYRFDEDDLSVTSTEFAKDYEFINSLPTSPNLGPEAALTGTDMFETEDPQGESKLQRTQAWVEEDIEVVPYPIHDGNFDNSSVETDQASKFTRYYQKRYKGKQCVELNCVIRKKSHSKAYKSHRAENKSKNNIRTKLTKKVSRKKSCNSGSGVNATHSKFISVNYKTYRVKPRKKQIKHLHPTAAKPIPASLIELCNPESEVIGHDIGTLHVVTDSMTKIGRDQTLSETKVAVTKESMLIEIITQNIHETIALHRTIGTDADVDSMIFEDETLIRSISNTLMNEDDVFEKHIATENVYSQTIFLYDINEPTTSKGIRHIGMDVQCGPDATAPVYCMISATTSLTTVPKIFKAGIKIGDFATDTKIISTDFETSTCDTDNNYRTIIPRNRSVGIKIKESGSNILMNRKELSTVSTYSVLSATTSSTRISNILSAEIKVINSKTNKNAKNTEFEAFTTTPKGIYNSYFPMETVIGIKIKDSISLIPKQPESLTDTDEEFNYKPEIFESPQPYSVNEGFHKDVLVNVECSTNTQELDDKLILSSQQLFKNGLKVQNEPGVELELKDFSSNPPNKVEYSTTHLGSCDKPHSLPRQKFENQKSPKGKQKRSVDFQLQDPISHIPQRVKYLRTAQKSCNKKIVSSQKTTSKVIPFEKPVSIRSDIFCEFDPGFLSKIQCLTDVSRASTPSLPPFSKETITNISKLDEIFSDIEIKNDNSNLPEKNDLVEHRKISQPSSNETALQTSYRKLENDYTPSNICMNIDNVCETYNTLNNSEIQALSVDNKIADNSGRTDSKNFIRKLGSGGVQVHSYRDKQSLSEDIIYQGQWQQNKPKALAKRKCCIPAANKKNDLYLKKKVNSKELIKSSRVSSKEISRINDKIKNDVTPNLGQSLLPRNTIVANLKQELSDIKENNQDLKLSKTVCIATIAKPFRNILKVPSKFPISNLPSKNPKSFKTTIVKKTPATLTSLVKKDEKTPRKEIRKNYIPLYLRQKGVNCANKAELNVSLDSVASKTKNSKETKPKLLTRSKTEEIKRDLLKFRPKPLQPEYVVFRNEIEKKKSDGQHKKNTSDSAKKKDASRQRSSTPKTSPNSSTCSSPCSIATVRAVSAHTKNGTSRRHSSSSYINNAANSGSENSTPERNRKNTKRCKSARVIVENKENIPQTSKHFNVGKNDSAKHGKGIFMSQKKNIYISQVKDSLQSTDNTQSKDMNQKSNVNITKKKSFISKKSSPCLSLSLSNKASGVLDASLSTTRNEISECAQTSNMVLIIEPQTRQLPMEPTKLDDINVVNHCFVTKNVDNIDKESIDGHPLQNINSTMRDLLDEALDFIDNPLGDEHIIESDMFMFNRENLAHVDSPESPTSFKTFVTSDDNNPVLPSDIEYALNRSFDTTYGNESILSLNDMHFAVTDFDVLSFKSITSGSRLSGYLSADTEFSSSIKLPKCDIPAPNPTSVREIFERKEQPFQPAQNQNTTGALANQAFSGFTLNEDSIAGDKPDLINLIDSETGSLLAVAIPRQANSEELLISGRSSDSFESCVLDDDTVVPNWLFQLISQQASSLDELEPPAELMVSLPVVEPLFDDNANAVEAPGAGAGAGAGDGRGIHSDHSQDSSGRGTSLSSRETSSGPQSEVILIDPAAFAAQFELLRDAVEGSVVLAINNPDGSDNATGSGQVPVLSQAEPQSFSGGESRRTPRVVLTSASDADADVSSFDTDEVPDLSDN